MIPFVDLTAQYRAIADQIEQAVLETLRSGHYVLGPPVQRFEQDFAAYCGTRHAIAVNSGTSALHLALQAAGIGPGDEVITVPMTFIATVAAILYAGATPVLADIDPVTWTLDPSALEAAIGPRTAAIIPVHLHGMMADMASIMRLAERHGLLVIEDAAQAHGARYKGRRSGSIGHAGCFSFYPSKNLGAAGEGGALTTSDDALADRARRLRDWGQDGKYNHVLRGHNYRMDAIQGAILGVKLRHLDGWTAARRFHAQRFGELLAGSGWQLPVDTGEDRHAVHVYAPLLEERAAVERRLSARGIGTGIHYPRPVHLQPAFAELGYRAGTFPVSERMAAGTLSLPMFPELVDAQIREICETALASDDAAAA
jgi:dTDP-4-amino-4,6-dideoxygalactose transaminase